MVERLEHRLLAIGGLPIEKPPVCTGDVGDGPLPPLSCWIPACRFPEFGADECSAICWEPQPCNLPGGSNLWICGVFKAVQSLSPTEPWDQDGPRHQGSTLTRTMTGSSDPSLCGAYEWPSHVMIVMWLMVLQCCDKKNASGSSGSARNLSITKNWRNESNTERKNTQGTNTPFREQKTWSQYMHMCIRSRNDNPRFDVPLFRWKVCIVSSGAAALQKPCTCASLFCKTWQIFVYLNDLEEEDGVTLRIKMLKVKTHWFEALL